MASQTRIRTITKTDMEASRLVFVFVRDAKPKRKVAVPVPDGYSWEEFLNQVKHKLKIVGVKEVQLVSSGQKVTSLDELQDIDELCVTEGLEGARSVAISVQGSLPPGADGTAEIQSQPSHPHHPDRQQGSPMASKAVMSTAGSVGVHSKHVDSDNKKYYRRSHPLRRLLQKWLPSLFTPTLPISTRDVASASGDMNDVVRLPGKKRKGRRGALSVRNILLLLAVATCVMTMLWLMMHATPNIS